MLKAASSLCEISALSFLPNAYRKIIRSAFGLLYPTIVRYPPLFPVPAFAIRLFEQASSKIGFYAA
jgi:hypothetical protein